jgi:hypothetical protein
VAKLATDLSGRDVRTALERVGDAAPCDYGSRLLLDQSRLRISAHGDGAGPPVLFGLG